jgi:hypothetical protein
MKSGLFKIKAALVLSGVLGVILPLKAFGAPFNWNLSHLKSLGPGVKFVAQRLPISKKLAYVVQVDTQTPGIRFYTNERPANYKPGVIEAYTRTMFQHMADSKLTDHKLVAAITGAPFGPCCSYGDNLTFVQLSDSVVFDGVASKWSLKNNRPAFVVSRSGTPSLRVLTKSEEIDNMQIASTGFSKVLDAGVVKGLADSPRVGYNSTGIGIDKDGRYVYFVTVMNSDWLILGTAMQYFGSYDGVGMDGGGSAQMAYRDPKTSRVVSYKPSEYTEPRSIANIVGVYFNTEAPAIAQIATNLLPVAVEGEDAPSDSFQVWNSGGMTLDYTLSDDADWLSLSEASGRSVTQRNSIRVNYQTAGLAPGMYSAMITVSGSGLTPQTIPVNLTILPEGNKPPVITLPARVDQPTVVLGSTVEASVLASDPEGDSPTYTWSAISGPGSAKFANPTGSSTSVSFTEAGTYVLRATISDGEDINVTSDVIVKVQSPPVPIAISESIQGFVGEPIEIVLKGFDSANRPFVFPPDYLIKAPLSGKLSGTPPNLIYTSKRQAPDSLEFKLKAGSQESLPGTGRIYLSTIPRKR